MTAPQNPGAEPVGAGGHESAVGDITLLTRIFASIGAGILVMAVIYWFASYEEAGSVMLLLASVLVFVVTAFLWTEDRHIGHPTAAFDDQGDHYLPHASPWPFGIGLGVYLIANGLILGPAYTVPGIVGLAGSVVGFLRQSRARS